jgi:hypothetical protein
VSALHQKFAQRPEKREGGREGERERERKKERAREGIRWQCKCSLFCRDVSMVVVGRRDNTIT